MTDERLYSVDEANAILPELELRLRRVREARQEILAAAERIGARRASDGGGRDGRAYHEALATLREEVERLGREAILLRDAETGLIDFPAEREGRRVFLCWRFGEARVEHWHEVDAGFAGRRPL